MPTIIHFKLLALPLAGLLWLLPAISQSEPGPIVAAASDLQFALREIAADFHATSGKSVRLNFGSSGNFHRQIMQGAPFELYMSADEHYVFDLARAGRTLDRGRLYAIGRLAVIAPRESAVLADPALEELRRRLERGELNRFAIANPEHAPYGIAAKQVLQTLGLWDAIQPHLIFGENVSQAAQFAVSGETDGGIIAYSLALAPALRERARHALLPTAYHAPLRQRMVLLEHAGDTARRFYRYLQGEDARDVFSRYGFLLPGENPSADNR